MMIIIIIIIIIIILIIILIITFQFVTGKYLFYVKVIKCAIHSVWSGTLQSNQSKKHHAVTA